MMKFSILFLTRAIGLAILTSHALPVIAADVIPQPTAEVLRSELKKVQADIEAAQRGVDEKMKQLRERQHRAEYNDPEIVALREELLDLERRALQKREQISARLALVPEIKRIEEERREYFKRLQELRETEAAIRRELAARERE